MSQLVRAMLKKKSMKKMYIMKITARKTSGIKKIHKKKQNF